MTKQPEATKRSLTFYSSQEEQQKAKDRASLAMSPQERLRNTVRLIRLVYAKELVEYVDIKKITVKDVS